MKLEFLDRFSIDTQIPNFMKIRSVRAELFHADELTKQTGMAKSRFVQFCECAQQSLSTTVHVEEWRTQ